MSFRQADPYKRYMFTYGNSVHMDPDSEQSKEELARCAAEKDHETIRQVQAAYAAAVFPETQEGDQETQDRRHELNPEADPFGSSASAGSEPAWNETRLEAEEQPDGQYASDYDNIGVETDQENNTYSDNELEPSDTFEGGPECEAEFVNDYNILENEPRARNDTHEDLRLSDLEGGIEIESEAESLDSVYTAPATQVTADFLTGSPRETSFPAPETIPEYHDLMGARSTYGGSHKQPSEAADHANSDRSVYYDPNSNPPSPRLKQNDHDAGHDFSPGDNDFSDTALEDSSSSATPCDPVFLEEGVAPHLAPLVSFFNEKLTDKSGQYTQDDLKAELRGIVVETYCGWLETLRVTIPGAKPLPSKNELDQRHCRHLGYWEKQYGQSRCKACNMWRPVFTLLCSGCGLYKCAACRAQV